MESGIWAMAIGLTNQFGAQGKNIIFQIKLKSQNIRLIYLALLKFRPSDKNILNINQSVVNIINCFHL